MKELLQLGSCERSGLASGWPCVILWLAGLLCSGVGSTFYCPRFWRGLCVWVLALLLLALLPFALLLGWVCFSGLAGDIFHLGVAMHGFPRMVGLLAALLEVCLPVLSGWYPFRVPQVL